MSKLNELIEKVQKETDTIVMCNASTFGDTIENCMPYDELEDCETLRDLSNYLQDFIYNLEDVTERIYKFIKVLNDIDNECD